MTESLKVTTDDLRRHAGHVDIIADGLDTAGRAGNATDPGPESYGQLCLLVPMMLSQLQGPLIEVIGVASRSVRGNSDALINAADLYESTDETNASEIRLGGGGR